MRFGNFDQPVEYSEDADYFNVTRRAKYLYRVEGNSRVDPPTGMRSAIPLGGLGGGTIELRADGSFQDWNIFNNSPAGGSKIQIDDTFFALKTKARDHTRAWTLRTQPPENLPAITQIEYSGAFPVSRLRFSDPDCPVVLSLYAYSEFYPRDAEASATPAIIFTFELHNPSGQSVDATLLFNLRNYAEGQLEPGHPLTFFVPGKTPASGTIAMRAEGDGFTLSSLTASDLGALWGDFVTSKHPQAQAGFPRVPRYGALSAKTSLGPGESRLITYVLAWHLPYRPFKNQVPGNYYTRLYASADDVAERVLGRLPATWTAIREWQETMFDNSLPPWLQDMLINSVATMYKTGQWMEDGRWRQWESFSCAGLDPVHIDFYRILPYAFFFPSLQKQLMAAHARYQLDDGFIHEQLTQGCFTADSELDDAGGRVMGDSATGFLLEAWQIYSWTGDKAFLDSIWPNLKKAAEWQIHRSETYGLPQKLENTYDGWQFGDKDLVSYNAFLHLSAMRAAEKLATVEGAPALAEEYKSAFERGQKSLYEHFWTGDYFRSWWMSGMDSPDALHADTLYGQLWAFILELGPVADEKKMEAHLNSEARINGSPFGLKVMRRADPGHPDMEDVVPLPGRSVPSPRDNMIWQAGSLDWTSLSIYLGGDPMQSLGEAEKIVRNWQDRMRNQWDFTDTVAAWNGDLWCNSHYARQLIAWSIPLALSGQQYYAPEQRLSFDPRVAAPNTLPFFTPTATGRLQLLGAGRYRLTVDSGQLDLHELRVRRTLRRQRVSLAKGESVELME
jgi:non-lysosomal glucosylceramidase